MCGDGLQWHCTSRDGRTWQRGEWVGGLVHSVLGPVVSQAAECALLSPHRQYRQVEACFSVSIELNPQKQLFPCNCKSSMSFRASRSQKAK